MANTRTSSMHIRALCTAPNYYIIMRMKNRRIKRIITVLLIITLPALCLSACSAPAETQSPAETAQSSAAPAPPGPAAPPPSAAGNPSPPAVEPSPFPITVIDQAGREVTIAEAPQRIVSGYYISTSAVIALGLADRLVGIEARAASRPIYSLAAPGLLGLPDVGTAREFNLEACLALEPELVILPMRLGDIAEILGDMGVPAILVNPESNEELLEMVSLIGNAAGTVNKAERLRAYYQTSIEEIAALTASVTDKPAVCIGGASSYLATASGDMYQSVLIEMAGGINVAAGIGGEGRQEISYEQLLAFDPEVIIVPSEASYSIDEITADKQLVNLRAVRNGNVYQMPSAFEAWDSPVPSGILGVKWLLSILHGDIYPMEKTQNSAFEFYKEFYGIEIDTSLIG